jgi:hypothetical protein
MSHFLAHSLGRWRREKGPTPGSVPAGPGPHDGPRSRPWSSLPGGTVGSPEWAEVTQPGLVITFGGHDGDDPSATLWQPRGEPGGTAFVPGYEGCE